MPTNNQAEDFYLFSPTNKKQLTASKPFYGDTKKHHLIVVLRRESQLR